MLHIQGKESYKYVVSSLKCMTDDLNNKFKEYYAENGVDANSVSDFDMDTLDYIHWGHHAVAFPSFFEVTSLDSLEGWAYSGYHGPDGVRVAKYNFIVGQPDPRCLDYKITRILSSHDMNKVPTILLECVLDSKTDSVVTKLPIWVYAAESPDFLKGAMVNTFGGGKITIAQHDSDTVSIDHNFTVYEKLDTEEE
jgi:hypothetical protein